MFAHRESLFWRAPTRIAFWLALCCAVTTAGCGSWQLPRIDPTGERLFIPGGAPLPPPPGALGQWGITVSPSRVIAPVGSEVVMIASVTGPEGFPLTRERVEWSLAPDGVGEFISPGERRPLEVLNWMRRLPRKVDTTYAINTTLTAAMPLDRGTPTAADDVTVQAGQAWVSVTSPTAGTSHLTVFAPEISGWDRRKQSASIYWVDVQWRFPPPAISAAGSRSTLTTMLTRASDGSPLAGWAVRYEVVGGPLAGFAPDGGTSVEVVTGPGGEAPAEIFQQQPAAGTNQINVSVISPGGPAGPDRRLTVGSGATFQTWTGGPQQIPPTTLPPTAAPPTIPPAAAPPSSPPAVEPQPSTPAPTPTPQREPQLDVTLTGPATAVVGSDVQFEIQIVNRGDAPATNILVSDRFDEGLVHARASGVIERDLIDLPPGGVSRTAVSFRIGGPGELCQNVTVTAAGGVRATARRCITATAPMIEQPPEQPADEPTPLPAEPSVEPTLPEEPQTPGEQPPAAAPANLVVTKQGPARRLVGETALFVIEVTNNGTTPIEELQIADNFETSLEPSRATGGYQWLPGNALGWKVESLAAGQTARYEIELRCLRPTPRACNRVTVSAEGMEPLADEACLEIATEAEQAAPAPAAQAGAPVSVTLAETVDPIKINGETTYQVVVTNDGTESAFDVELSVKFGDELRLEGLNGPVQGSVAAGAVRFTPLRELRGGEKASFEIRFKGTQAGTARVQAEASSRGQASPATAEQTTVVLQ